MTFSLDGSGNNYTDGTTRSTQCHALQSAKQILLALLLLSIFLMETSIGVVNVTVSIEPQNRSHDSSASIVRLYTMQSKIIKPFAKNDRLSGAKTRPRRVR